MRDSLQQLRAPAEAQGTAASGGESPRRRVVGNRVTEVRADRLSDALTRLRAGTEPIDPVPVPAGPRDAGRSGAGGRGCQIDRTAGRRSPARSGPCVAVIPRLAGQLALSLLPMQWIAYPQPVSYDIVLGPGHGCVQVTSGDDGTEVARQATARPLEQVDFQLVGGPERFAKLLAAGRIRRRLGFWVFSRVRGNRDGLGALDALLALPLELPALVEVGVSTDPLILAQLQAWIKRAQSE